MVFSSYGVAVPSDRGLVILPAVLVVLAAQHGQGYGFKATYTPIPWSRSISTQVMDSTPRSWI